MSAVLRVLSTVCLTLAIMLVVALHMVSELDPVARRLSEYATGPNGIVMTTAFFLVGLGLGCAGGLFIRDLGVLPGVALVLAGIGMIVAGFYPTEPNSATAAESFHSTGSAVATGLVVFAMLWVSFIGRPKSTTMRLVAAAGAVLAVASVGLHESAISGLSQRLLWITLLSWTMIAVWWLRPMGGESP